jgi:16S rRNA (cytosine967-C5)-methyltransferase
LSKGQVRSARDLAYRALVRIEHEGAYANLVVPAMLRDSGLEERDRAFATELVYGTTRMRRACAFLVDRFVLKPPPKELRTLLHLGAYQLAFAGVAPHAAVSATVDLAPSRSRGFVNAVLRRVASQPVDWPDDATRLSYPDWIVTRLRDELGEVDALAALERMNDAPTVTERADGYVQDRASQWVADLVEARPGQRVLDVCAAPGGKATALAAAGAAVVANDLQPQRARLIAANARRLRADVPVVTADGTSPPFAADSFDRVLIDAPCSGLGVLRRRADARWRLQPSDVDDLAQLQQRLIDASAPLVKPGGVLVYSVCTLTAVESIEHHFPDGWEPLEPPGAPWRPYGAGARLFPHDADTDGMVVVRYRRPYG